MLCNIIILLFCIQFIEFYRNMILRFLLVLPYLVSIVSATGSSLPSLSFPNTNTFAKTKDNNVIYAATSADYKIYRMNYSRYINQSIVSFHYQTTHTKQIRTIGISQGQTYLATGSLDGTIEVVAAYTKVSLCKFNAYNQLRSIVFHPRKEEIFYAASVDDAIRKYNITNCSMLVQKSVGGSVNVMNINDDGLFLVYGTYEGHVGKIDENLATNSLTSKPHLLTVMYLFMLYHDIYLTIGDDNAAILWNSGNNIFKFESLSPKQLVTCGLFNQYDQIYNYRVFGCYQKGGTTFSTLASKTAITRFILHMSVSGTPNWVDFRRTSADEQIFVYQASTTLYAYRVYEEPNTLCNGGTYHFSVDSTLDICRHCGYIFPGCHLCNSGSTSCNECGVGTFLSGGRCVLCTASCASCASSSACSTCATGYRRNGGSNGLCVATSGYVGCFQIQWNGNNGNGLGGSNECKIAGNGYYVSSGQSNHCSTNISGCMECTSSSYCITCRTGYYMSYGSCPACSTTMPGCLACASSSTCFKCSVAFKYNGANLQCSNCFPTCQTCMKFYDECSTCYPAQNRELSGTKCLCKISYFDNSTSGNYTCPLCSSVLTYCYLCTNSTVCTQCLANYYTYTFSGKTQCQQCDKYCQTCQGISTNCTSCNSITYFRELTGSTCTCMVGYVSVGGSVPCLPCSQLNIGCVMCTNQTYCTICLPQYYLQINGSSRLCKPCPYYCSDCSVNGSGVVVCNVCPANTFRSLVNGSCPCISGYFDDNRTLVCEKCSDVLSDCLTCQNRTKCTGCAPGMFTDTSHSFCALCNPTCLTCGAYFDVCATCDPATNRVISANKCVCEASTYEENGICKLCSSAIRNCIQCQNQYICTGCQSGYTLQEDLKACIDCKGSINGCSTCTSTTNCTSCLPPFILVKNRCRCPNDQYTSQALWGTCKSYGIPGLKSRLGVQLQAHQHQNNTLIVFIRFRAKTLYVLNKKIAQSIKLSINGKYVPINFTYIQNNRVKISTQLVAEMQKPNVTVTFSKDVFYNEDLLTLSNTIETVVPTRLYLYEQEPSKSFVSVREALKYIFYIFKWVFFAFSLIGQGHLIFPFVVFIQLVPIFLMINMSLPANLSMVLDGMLTFQVQSVIPMFDIKSNFFVLFPPLTYDYYDLRNFLLLGKIGDMLLIVLVNILTKFDEGIVRMFPPGRVRRYLYESLVRRGYAVMSLCILSFQASLTILAGVYISYTQMESQQEVFNYCCCIFAVGFYLVYNFNHASNLQGGKTMKNIENEQCFFDLNSQEPSAPRTTLIVLATDFWLVSSFHLVGPMIYFIMSIILLVVRSVLHLKRDFYIGRIQFALRTFSNLFLLSIYCLMFVFYLGEKTIYISIPTAELLGLCTTIMIFLYIFFRIIEKVIYMLKLEADFLETKMEKLNTGENILIVNENGVENQQNQAKDDDKEDNLSAKSRGVHDFYSKSSKVIGNAFSGLGFRKKQQMSQGRRSDINQSNSITETNSVLLRSPYEQNGRMRNTQNFNKTKTFFQNSSSNKQKAEKQKFSRVKLANTSKYAINHLQLRYRAQQTLMKQEQ